MRFAWREGTCHALQARLDLHQGQEGSVLGLVRLRVVTPVTPA